MLKKILVIETSFPGDAVIATCIAEEIKRLDLETNITYLVRPEVAELLRFAPAIDCVDTFDKYGEDAGRRGIERVGKKLATLQFDLAIVINPSTRNRAVLKHTSIPYIRIFEEPMEQYAHRSERILTVLAQDFPNASLLTMPRLSPPAPKFPLPESFVAIAPGSVWATKCWLAERFRDVAAEYAKRGIASVIIGGKADVHRGAIVASGNPLAVDLTGKTTFAQAASIIARAKLVVANDSAPVHIATAVRTPVVAIFGPTVPAFGFAPSERLGAVVQAGQWCRPCTSHGPDICPIHTHECMKKISVEQVMAATNTFNKLAA